MPLIFPTLLSLTDPRLDVVANLKLRDPSYILHIGPSTAAQGLGHTASVSNQKAIAIVHQAVAKGLNAHMATWDNASAPSRCKGTVRALSGVTMTWMRGQFSYCRQIKVTDIIYESGRNDLDAHSDNGNVPLTTAQYLAAVQADLLDLKATAWGASNGGVRIWWPNLWRCSTVVGGVWAAAGSARPKVEEINSAMAVWCAANGIYLIDRYSWMTDFNNANLNPKAGYTRTDGQHYSPLGADADSDGYLATMGAVLGIRPIDYTVDPGNLATALQGSGGTPGANMSGIVPAGWTAGVFSASTPGMTAVGSYNADGSYRVALNPNGITDGAGDEFRLAQTADVTGLTNGGWYRAKAIMKITGSQNCRGAELRVADAATRSCLANANIDDSNTSVTGNNANALLMPANHNKILRSEPFIVTGTTASLRFNVRGFQNANAYTADFSKIEFIPVTNPNTELGV